MRQLLVGANLAGDGLRERLRSTTFAMLGLVTATGLGLVALAYNQGWPDFVAARFRAYRSSRSATPAIAADAPHGDSGRRAAPPPRPDPAPARPGRGRSRPVVRSPRRSQAPGAGGGVGWPGPRPGSVGARWGRRAGASRSGAGAPPLRPPPSRRPPSRRPAVARTRPACRRRTTPRSRPRRRPQRPQPRSPGMARRKATKRARKRDGAGTCRPEGAGSAGGATRHPRKRRRRPNRRPPEPPKEAPAPAVEHPGNGPRVRPLEVTLGRPGRAPPRSRLGPMAEEMRALYLIAGTDGAKIDATRARLRARAEREGGAGALEVFEAGEGRGAARPRGAAGGDPGDVADRSAPLPARRRGRALARPTARRGRRGARPSCRPTSPWS